MSRCPALLDWNLVLGSRRYKPVARREVRGKIRPCE